MYGTFSFMVGCLLAIGCVVSYDSVPVRTEGLTEAKHIVFFGDSLIRYQYLAYVYKIHFQTGRVPGFLINEKLFGNWNEFFENTTEVFDGSMSCDCFREASTRKLATSRENRRYTHPSGRVIVSYFPLMGHYPIQGLNRSAIREFFGQHVADPHWAYTSPISFVKKYLPTLHPTPSVIFVNSGHWRNKQIAKNPRALLESLEEVVLSSSTSVPSASRKCVAWLGTTKPNIPWWAGARDADWSIIRGKYCQRSLAASQGVLSDLNRQTQTQAPVQTSSLSLAATSTATSPLVASQLRVCVFVPFDIPVHPTDYFDHMHFSNESIYHIRTERALKACNLMDFVHG